jgi:hypothetical protein
MLLATAIIRYQYIMKDVMAAHIELYNKVRWMLCYILVAGWLSFSNNFEQSVHDRVRSECGGKFKDLLLAVLNAAWPEQI